jgi:hypothetical protein
MLLKSDLKGRIEQLRSEPEMPPVVERWKAERS